MDEKSALLARLAVERAGLWLELNGLAAETLTAQNVFAGWTPKDILAHIAAWDEVHANDCVWHWPAALRTSPTCISSRPTRSSTPNARAGR
jgi:hypothetical protein